VPEGRDIQDLPPDVVDRILPREPTAQPCEPSRNVISMMSSRPPSVSRCQPSPLSSLRNTKPPLPAVQPVFSSAKKIVTNRGLVRMLTGNQSFPPLTVLKIVPLLVLIQPWFSLAK